MFREALTWKRLEHKNVLPFIGVDAKSFPICVCMVSPWMDHGTLSQFVSRHVDVSLDFLVRIPCSPWFAIAHFQTHPQLYGVVEGLQYLHREHIIHGDLRGVRIQPLL
jgi:serine/threonine protein kinase